MRRFLLIFFGCFVALNMAFAGILSQASAEVDPESPVVFLDGKKMAFKGVDPIIVDGSTLVPLRKIFESLGAKIEWVEETQTVIAKRNELILTYTIGDLSGKKNNEIVSLPVAGQLINGYTMIPLRFVSETFGAIVKWDQNSRTILISSRLRTEVEVTDVSDGGVIAIKRGEQTDKMVLLGFDSLDPIADKEALNEIKSRLTNAAVTIETDTVMRDKRGYLLAYVYFADGTMLNADLLASGYTKLKETTTAIRWLEWFKYVQAGAKNENIGVWAS